jgi:hypothetical protein
VPTLPRAFLLILVNLDSSDDKEENNLAANASSLMLIKPSALRLLNNPL